MIDWLLALIAVAFVMVFWKPVVVCVKSACILFGLFLIATLVFAAAFIICVYDAFFESDK